MSGDNIKYMYVKPEGFWGPSYEGAGKVIGFRATDLESGKLDMNIQFIGPVKKYYPIWKSLINVLIARPLRRVKSWILIK